MFHIMNHVQQLHSDAHISLLQNIVKKWEICDLYL